MEVIQKIKKYKYVFCLNFYRPPPPLKFIPKNNSSIFKNIILYTITKMNSKRNILCIVQVFVGRFFFLWGGGFKEN